MVSFAGVSGMSTGAQVKVCAEPQCGKNNPEAKVCGVCKLVFYCNTICQKRDWKRHKVTCRPPQKLSVTTNFHNEIEGPLSFSQTETHKVWDQTAIKNEPTVNLTPPTFSETPETTNSRAMHTTVNADVIQFSSNFNMATIEKLGNGGYVGLQTHAAGQFQHLAAIQDYVEILKCIWTEKNIDQRIQFLRPFAEQGHVIMMFELFRALGMEMLLKKDFSEDKIKEMMKWRILGQHCTIMDIACNNDPTCQAARSALIHYYTPILKEFKDHKVQEKMNGCMTKEAMETIIREWSPLENHPSPKWIAYHGMGVLSGTIDVKPETEWLACRQQAKEKTLQEP